VRSLYAVAATLALAGCASGYLLQMQAPEFELSGRFAVQYGKEAASGNLDWRHGADDDELLLSSPLGQGLARIVRTGPAVVLTTSDGRELRAADAESLTEQALGFRLPLAGLADWVRGRPAPQPPPTSRRDGAGGRLAELEQSGWKIAYLEYDETGPSPRPSRLRLTYPGLELRVAISAWKRGP